MRKFLYITFLIFLPLLPFSAQASIKDDIYYTWEGVKIYTSDGWKWTKYGTRRTIESVSRGNAKIDSALLNYITPSDLKYLQDNKVSFQIGNTHTADYAPLNNGLSVNKSFLEKYSKEAVIAYIHHEVQHVKDFQALKEAGYSLTSLDQVKMGATGMDTTSDVLIQGILEARAYSEQMVFTYQNMQNNPDNKSYRLAYERIVDENGYAKAFDDGIKSGKTTEDARHLSAQELLNSNFFKKGYLDKFTQRDSDNLYSISIDEILDILGKDKLTKEDIYAAYNFWENLCSNSNTSESNECLAYKARKRLFCGKKKKTLLDLDCAVIIGRMIQGRKLAEEEKKLYEMCCTKKGDKKK